MDVTTREKQLVRDSLPSIREVAGPVSKLFYGRLFELEPSLRGLFHEDIGRQGLKLVDMLLAVVDNLDCIEALNPVLQSMGQRHVEYGVTARHYGLLEPAMLWSLGLALEREFDPETRDAWRKVLDAISIAMQQGAAASSRQ